MIITGDTYAERARAGTLAGRVSSTSNLSGQSVYLQGQVPSNAKPPYLVIDATVSPPNIFIEDGT